MFDEFSIIDET